LTPLFAQERMLSDEQKAEAVKEFKKQWGSWKDSSSQQEAIFTLRAAESPEAANELVRLFDHKIPEVRNAAISVLGLYRNEATFKPYLDEIAALKPVQHRSQLIEVFGKAKLAAALPVFKLILEKDK